jgi:hypothetical protein
VTSTYYPIGGPSGGGTGRNGFTFFQGDLSPSGKLVVDYVDIVSPPSVTVYDNDNRRLFPGEIDLTPGSSSGQIELDFASILFSGLCRGKIS